MPSWKKLIQSGSDAHLSQITASIEVATPSLTVGDSTITSFQQVINEAQGIFYSSGSTDTFGNNVYATSASIAISGSVLPKQDATFHLGYKANKWKSVYAQDTFFGGVHELNLETPGLGKLPTGTILVWRDGTLVACDSEADYLIMGVVKQPSDSPVILGAEPILVTGPVEEGDFIITSAKEGHGKGVKQNIIFKKDLFGKVIAQALESCDGESNLIKCMIRKM